MSEADEDGGSSQHSKHLKTQTLEENYKETVELVKKYIRVDVPNLQPSELDRSNQNADLSLNY